MHCDRRNDGGLPVPALSVVVPVYGCQPCLMNLHQRLTVALEGLGVRYEIVLVDDRAKDGSWPVIEELADVDPRVRGILLSRNFGQHAAITAGLRHARGAWIAVMDCDLQDPPEDLPRLYAKALEGHDIVFGRRTRKRTGFARTALAKLYFWGLRVFIGARLEGQYGSFSVISRRVADAFLELPNVDRHYLMVLFWLGFDVAAVDYEPADRYRGRSSYSLTRLVEHAVDGVLFQTTVLLRWVLYLGFLLASIGGALAMYLICARLLGTGYPGWTSIVVLMLALCGFIIISTGITGLYVGKVFDRSRGRPVFVVDRVAEHPQRALEGVAKSDADVGVA
jgi:glycosyltransferase involved in cell wall biosynthesis